MIKEKIKNENKDVKQAVDLSFQLLYQACTNMIKDAKMNVMWTDEQVQEQFDRLKKQLLETLIK